MWYLLRRLNVFGRLKELEKRDRGDMRLYKIEESLRFTDKRGSSYHSASLKQVIGALIDQQGLELVIKPDPYNSSCTHVELRKKD
jgi:hypothetical protein